jgi:drug/metabolite transporter (DMT)-like permease
VGSRFCGCGCGSGSDRECHESLKIRLKRSLKTTKLGEKSDRIFYAITAAILFGVNTPLSKALLGQATPYMLAGLLYLDDISLLLFVLALRHIGTAHTGAYFAIAPFVGVAIAILFLKEPITTNLLLVSELMAIGV